MPRPAAHWAPSPSRPPPHAIVGLALGADARTEPRERAVAGDGGSIKERPERSPTPPSSRPERRPPCSDLRRPGSPPMMAETCAAGRGTWREGRGGLAASAAGRGAWRDSDETFEGHIRQGRGAPPS